MQYKSTRYKMQNDPYVLEYKPFYSPPILMMFSKLPMWFKKYHKRIIKEVLVEDEWYIHNFIEKHKLIVRNDDGSIYHSQAITLKPTDKLPFLKYRDKKLSHIMQLDKSYVDWMVKFDFLIIEE